MISTDSVHSPHPAWDWIRTVAGHVYDDILKLKKMHRDECERWRKLLAIFGNGDVVAVGAGADTNGGVHGGAVAVVTQGDGGDVALVASVDLSPTADANGSFLSFLAPSSFHNSDDVDTDSLAIMESVIFAYSSFAAFSSTPPCVFDLAKVPSSYTEALARPDASVWSAAMSREEQSLAEMGAFEEVDLPPRESTVGLIWVFAHKTDAAGILIPGKEKARIMAQGFRQRPGQFDETYAPVVKMARIWILLAWATVQDLEVYQFDCKTAFLHVKLRHPVYTHPYPSYHCLHSKNVLAFLSPSMVCISWHTNTS